MQFGVLVQVLSWGAGVLAIWGLCWCICSVLFSLVAVKKLNI